MRALPRWADVVLLPVLNLVLALVITAALMLLLGRDPVAALRALAVGSVGSMDALGYTLFYATDLVFTGLAVSVAFQGGLFNIGAEGQAALGGLGLALGMLWLDGLSAWIAIPVAVMAGAAAGAGWAAVPGWLQARRGSHIVITTIMFNFLAATLLAYLLVTVLIRPGSMMPETRDFASSLPRLSEWGLPTTAPVNVTLLLALLAAVGVWLLVWRTPWGYGLRVMGSGGEVARYAGVDQARMTVVAMALSGALASGVAVNELLGAQHRLLLGFTGGAGFTGIAVALMGRNHPGGVVLAALLFGALTQGGAELAFDVPDVPADIVVLIQGLVILLAGAMGGLLRPGLARVLGRGVNDLWFVVGSMLRLATPLLLGALAGLFSERAGIVDVGLEGKMLAGAFASAAVAAVTGSAVLGLAAAVAGACLLGLVHAYACVNLRGNQVVSGMAINIITSGLTATLAVALFHAGGQTPALPGEARFLPVLAGQSVLTVAALVLVPVAWVVLGRTRFGLRLRASGENPAALDAAGVSVAWTRYSGVLIASVLCGVAGTSIALAQGAGFQRDMVAGRGYIALAAMILGHWRPWPVLAACLGFGLLDAVAIRLQGVPIPGVGVVPDQAVQALPFVLTVVLLAGFVGRAVPPRASGEPYVKER